MRATPKLSVDIKWIVNHSLKEVSIYLLLRGVITKILTIIHTIQYLGGWGGGVNFNNHLLALLHTNIQEILQPLSSLFLKMCCICVLFTRCKFPVTDKIMCGSRKNPYLSPPPRIFHSRGSLITSPLPHSPLEFPEFLNRDFLPPSEIQSGFGTSKRRKWILTQLWNTVKFYYNSVNFCQAY